MIAYEYWSLYCELLYHEHIHRFYSNGDCEFEIQSPKFSHAYFFVHSNVQNLAVY